MQYITHITLNNGDHVGMPGDRPDPKMEAIVQDMIHSALGPAQYARLPEPHPFVFRAWRLGRSLMTRLSRTHHDKESIVTTVVFLEPNLSLQLWSALHENRPNLRTCPKCPPAKTWIADRIDPGAARSPMALSLSSDLSRCAGSVWVKTIGPLAATENPPNLATNRGDARKGGAREKRRCQHARSGI